MNFLGKLVVFHLGCLVVGLLFGGWLTVGFTMTSSAMTPSIPEGKVVFVNRVSAGTREPGRGDVVLVRVPDSEAQVVRRVVGLPGETVEVVEGRVLVNGARIEEQWLAPPGADEPRVDNPFPVYFPATVLGEDRYFVLSDFRKVGNDSRVFGPVRKGAILGTVWVLFGHIP